MIKNSFPITPLQTFRNPLDSSLENIFNYILKVRLKIIKSSFAKLWENMSQKRQSMQELMC